MQVNAVGEHRHRKASDVASKAFSRTHSLILLIIFFIKCFDASCDANCY